MNNKDFNLKEKDMYKLFNETKLEESEFDDLDKEITNIQKERIKKNLNKRIRGKRNLNTLKYSTIAASAALVCLLGIGTASPTFAKNIPGLNSIIQTLTNKSVNPADYAKYSEVINKSVKNNGISVTINEVIADDAKLIISYTIKSDNKIKDKDLQMVGLGLGRFLKINDKQFGSGGSSKGKYTDDYTFIGSEEIHTTLPQDSNKLNISLNIAEISDIKGKWNFTFSTSKDAIYKESIVFKPNKKIELPDSTVAVDKVVFSPIDTSIFSNVNYKDKDMNTHFEAHNWIVLDDRGVELIPTTSSTAISGNSSEERNFVKQKRIPKYLTIIPYISYSSEVSGIKGNGNVTTSYTIKRNNPEAKEISKAIDGIYPLELSQGKMGKLTIKEIKTENNKTIVKFTTEGKAPYIQAENLHIKDANGKTVTPLGRVTRESEDKCNELTQIYELFDTNEKYTAYTNDFNNVELREDLKFNIELNK